MLLSLLLMVPPVGADKIVELVITIGEARSSISPACCTPLVAASRVLLAIVSGPSPFPASSVIVPRIGLGLRLAVVVEILAFCRSTAAPVTITSPAAPAWAPAGALNELATLSVASPTCTVPEGAASLTVRRWRGGLYPRSHRKQSRRPQ